jgi:SAM-dependent methyltransferase
MKSINNDLLYKFNLIEKKHWWWRGRRELVRRFILERDRKITKILDIGCGTGETMSFVKNLLPNSEVWGIDPSPVGVAFTRGRGHKLVKIAKAENLPFKNNIFDVVLILDVLEHIKDEAGVLKEIKRVLKPGGKVLITGPALKFIWSKHDTEQGHVTRFTRHQLKGLARKAGLKAEKIGYFNFVLSLPIVAIRLGSKVPGLGFMANYDRGINFDIAKIGWLNTGLTKIFETEVRLMNKLDYPWGISVAAILVKEK